jgi:hypothetical protein
MLPRKAAAELKRLQPVSWLVINLSLGMDALASFTCQCQFGGLEKDL